MTEYIKVLTDIHKHQHHIERFVDIMNGADKGAVEGIGTNTEKEVDPKNKITMIEHMPQEKFERMKDQIPEHMLMTDEDYKNLPR